MTRPRPLGGQRQPGARESSSVPAGELAPALVPVLEPSELHAEHGGLQRVDPAVAAVPDRPVALVLAVRAQLPHPLCKRGIVGHDGAGVPERAEVLRRVEAERRRVAKAADAPAAELRPVGLGGVVDHREAAVARELEQRLEVGALSVQVHWNECARARAAGPRRGVDVDRVGDGVDVREHRRGAGRDDRGHSGDARARRRDHLVPWPDAHGAQGELERVGARRDADRLARPAVRGELALERADLLAAQEDAAVEHALVREVELAAHLLRLATQVEEGDSHSGSPQYRSPRSRKNSSVRLRPSSRPTCGDHASRCSSLVESAK